MTKDEEVKFYRHLSQVDEKNNIRLIRSSLQLCKEKSKFKTLASVYATYLTPDEKEAADEYAESLIKRRYK